MIPGTYATETSLPPIWVSEAGPAKDSATCRRCRANWATIFAFFGRNLTSVDRKPTFPLRIGVLRRNAPRAPPTPCFSWQKAEKTPMDRKIRVVCPDGDPTTTKLLEMDGKTVPEAVRRATIVIEPGELARGVFLFYKPARVGFGDEFDTFEAEVVLGAA